MQSLLRSLATILSTTEIPEHRWKLASGIRIFPEGVCPFCSETIKSTEIWHIVGGYLKGKYKPKEQLIPKFDKNNFTAAHPHAGGSGSICLGNSTSEDVALFLAMNVEGAYGRWSNGYGTISRWTRFLKETWAHDCNADLERVLGRGGRDCIYCGGGWEMIGDGPRCEAVQSRTGNLCTRELNHPDIEHAMCTEDGHPFLFWETEEMEESPDDCPYCSYSEERCGEEYAECGCPCARPLGHTDDHVSCFDEHGMHTWPIVDDLSRLADELREDDLAEDENDEAELPF